MTLENVLILAKTAPEVSKKHGITICTLGLNLRTDQLCRIFPLQQEYFRNGGGFKRWDIIGIDLEKSENDRRIESYKVVDHSIKVTGHIGTGKGHPPQWAERRSLVLPLVTQDLCTIQHYQKEHGWDKTPSAAIIKVREIKNTLKIKPRSSAKNGDAACLEHLVKKFPEQMPWVGFNFLCMNPQCNGHEIMCLDWEIQELYRKTRLQPAALVRRIEDFKTKELYFMMGTVHRYPNSWIIGGTFYPPNFSKTSN